MLAKILCHNIYCNSMGLTFCSIYCSFCSLFVL
nr:MAG TPA: hypothetical protein [Caudoviricetes sp.]